MQKIYVDTNIFLDYWLDRKTKILPLGMFAKRLLDDIVLCKYNLIISDYILAEIKENITFFDEIAGFFDKLKLIKKLEIVKINRTKIIKAKELAKEKRIPIHDAIHAIIAKEKGAIVISRDKHFQTLKDFLQVFKPEEIID